MATILHVGGDLHGLRGSILKAAGFDVCSCPDPAALDGVLQTAERIDAVLISDDACRTVAPEVVADKIRVSFPSALTLLIPQPGRSYDGARFDKLFEPSDAAPVWLPALRELLSHSGTTLQRTRELHATSKLVQEEAHKLCSQSATLRAQLRRMRNRFSSRDTKSDPDN
ncbi:MAG: hypothetical protein ACE14L_16640 [Terriglobales bacterium]